MDIKLKILLLTALIATLAGSSGGYSFAETANIDQAPVADTMALGIMALGAGMAIAAAAVGAGIGLGMATSAIAAAGAERPEIIGRFFIFVVFIEALAIYALIVSIFIITMLPTYL